LRLNSGADAVEVDEVGDIALDRCGIAADLGDGLIELGLTAADIWSNRCNPPLDAP
jgi:hypothetical protein